VIVEGLAGSGVSDAAPQMIDATIIRAHHCAAGGNVWPAPSARNSSASIIIQDFFASQNCLVGPKILSKSSQHSRNVFRLEFRVWIEIFVTASLVNPLPVWPNLLRISASSLE
jgi:hypothetical protein